MTNDMRDNAQLSELINQMREMGWSDEDILSAVKSENLYPTKEDGFFKISPEGKLYPDYHGFGRYMKNEIHFKADDSVFYIYEDEHYKPASKTKLLNMIRELTKEKASPAQQDNFLKIAISHCYEKPGYVVDSNLINLSNGILKLDTKELLPHSSEFFFKYKLSHSYDPKANYPVKFLNFLNFVFNGDQALIQLTSEIFGYTLLGGDPIAHKAFLLFGEGRNGKSTWLHVLREFLGNENTCSISMKLLGKPFSMVSLDGKIANIVEESPVDIEPEDFKNIVGGGFVTAAHKGKPEFQLKINARMFFAANKMPHFHDATIGIKDRLLIIPFLKYIPEGARNSNIKAEILGEMSGILRFALDGIEAFRANGNKFSNANQVNEMLEEYIEESDSALSWLNSNLNFTNYNEDFVKLDSVYSSYTSYMRRRNQRSVGFNEFRRRANSWLKQLCEKNDTQWHQRRDTRKKMINGQNYHVLRRVKFFDENISWWK